MNYFSERISSLNHTIMQDRFVCIAVDMGASNIRIMAGIIAGAKIEYREMHRFSNEIKVQHGHERWDIEFIFAGISEGIRMVSGAV